MTLILLLGGIRVKTPNKRIKNDVKRLAGAHSSLIIAKHYPHFMRALSGLEARFDFRHLYSFLRHCCNYVLVY